MEKVRVSCSELQTAIDALRLRDIYLRDLAAKCADDYDPKYDTSIDKLVMQTKHHVDKSVVVEIDDDLNMLRVYVDLGARWIIEGSDGESEVVKALIEAKFIAEYSMKGTLDEACISEFSLKNVSYHVWPYWRELLSAQCERMHLPKVIIPMIQLANNRHDSQTPGNTEDDLQ